MRSAPKDVEEYIESAPEEARGKVREAAPAAPERISYGMPCYGVKRRSVCFGLAKAHIGLYGISAPIIERYRDEVEIYLAQKRTIRLPLAKDLPIELVKKLVKARMDEPEALL
jgi:uncharacterized protein YdhG (YjbR/CyaY superfamily)